MLKALAGGNKITPANASAYAEMRTSKVQEAIRSALVQGLPGDKIPGATATAVIAAGAAKLYHEAMAGVDGQKQPVYMRDRIKVWETVGAKAGLLEDQRSEAPAASAIAGLLGLALGLAAQRGEVVDADMVDISTHKRSIEGTAADATDSGEAETE